MSMVNTAVNAYAQSSAYSKSSTAAKKTSEADALEGVKGTETKKTSGSYGKTIGQPELSEKGAKYYEELKKKYGDKDFVLVSKDMKEIAKQQAGSFANPNKMVVLIDEEKIERMAEDEDYRKQYEGIIEKASTGLAQLKAQTAGNSNVKGYGMQVNDGGTASFFAVLKDSSKAQKARIEKKAAEKKEAKKAESKKAEEKRAEARKEKKAEKAEKTDSDWGKEGIQLDDDDVIISASSVEELLQKIGDYEFARRSDSVMTEAEKAVGGNIDFKG